MAKTNTGRGPADSGTPSGSRTAAPAPVSARTAPGTNEAGARTATSTTTAATTGQDWSGAVVPADKKQLVTQTSTTAAADPWTTERASAWSTLTAILSQYGIDVDGSGLSGQIRDWVLADMSADEMMLNVRQSQAYNDRFTGMAALMKRGQAIDEATYIRQERAYRETMVKWALPTGFYDEYKDFGSLIANGVSVKELDDRIQSAKTFIDTQTPQSYRDALRAEGINEGDMLAYVLDGERATSLIQQKVKAAAFGGAANAQGFGLDAAQMERYGATLGAQFDTFGADQRIALEGTLGKLGMVAKNDQRLAGIDQEQYSLTDALDAELLADTGKTLASQKRAQREQARFSGQSAITTGSLSRRGGV